VGIDVLLRNVVRLNHRGRYPRFPPSIAFDLKNAKAPPHPLQHTLKDWRQKDVHNRNNQAWLAPYFPASGEERACSLKWRIISGPTLTTATGADRLPGRPPVSFLSPIPRRCSSAIVALVASVSGIVSGLAQRRHRGDRFPRLFFLNPPRPRRVTTRRTWRRMLLLAATAGGTALINRPVCGRSGSMRSRGRRSITPPPTGCRPRSINVRHRHR